MRWTRRNSITIHFLVILLFFDIRDEDNNIITFPAYRLEDALNVLDTTSDLVGDGVAVEDLRLGAVSTFNETREHGQ